MPDNIWRRDRDVFVLAPVQDIDRKVSHSVAINSDRKTRQLSLQVKNSTRTSRKIPPHGPSPWFRRAAVIAIHQSRRAGRTTIHGPLTVSSSCLSVELKKREKRGGRRGSVVGSHILLSRWNRDHSEGFSHDRNGSLAWGRSRMVVVASSLTHCKINYFGPTSAL